jgi:GntR family transcriptional regulator
MKPPLDVQAPPGRQPKGERPAHDPKYVAICKDLRARITSGEYVPGRRLPSQLALAAAYGVSVMTLRQALAQLGDDGLVETTHGRGTFVAARPFEYRLNHLSSFAQDMRRQGKFVTTRVLFAGLVAEAEPELCARLALPSGERPYQLDRVRFVDGVPVVFQRSYLPAAIGRRLQANSLETESLYDVLRTQQQLDVVRAVETVKAVALPAAEAQALGRPPGSPALLSTRLSLAEGDRPIIFDKAYISGEVVEVFADRVADSLRLSFRVQ